MKYAVDKINEDIAVLENINTGEIININVSEIPNNIKEKDILIFEDNLYRIDKIEKENRINVLREKMNRLRGDNSEQ